VDRPLVVGTEAAMTNAEIERALGELAKAVLAINEAVGTVWDYDGERMVSRVKPMDNWQEIRKLAKLAAREVDRA
jgi:hypothetical protein